MSFIHHPAIDGGISKITLKLYTSVVLVYKLRAVDYLEILAKLMDFGPLSQVLFALKYSLLTPALNEKTLLHSPRWSTDSQLSNIL